MNDTERKEAIKEVLKWVKSGKQDLQNGSEEIDTINYIYEQDKVKKLHTEDVNNNKVSVCDHYGRKRPDPLGGFFCVECGEFVDKEK